MGALLIVCFDNGSNILLSYPFVQLTMACILRNNSITAIIAELKIKLLMPFHLNVLDTIKPFNFTYVVSTFIFQAHISIIHAFIILLTLSCKILQCIFSNTANVAAYNHISSFQTRFEDFYIILKLFFFDCQVFQKLF